MQAIHLEWTNLEYLSQRYGTEPLHNMFLLLLAVKFALFELSLFFFLVSNFVSLLLFYRLFQTELQLRHILKSEIEC